MHIEPRYFERHVLNRQKKAIECADFVVTLFPSIERKMKEYYNSSNVYFLGNVVNISNKYELSEDEINNKYRSNKILFIGRKWYREGALKLINAIQKFNNEEIQLNIVGMDDKDLGIPLPENVHCHGYLNKSNPEQLLVYNKLMKEAKIFSNPTDTWGVFKHCGSNVQLYSNYYYTCR